MNKNSKLSVRNNINLRPGYKTGMAFFYGNGPEIVKYIQTYQNKVLRSIVNAPWYVRNADLYRDLGIPIVKGENQKQYRNSSAAREAGPCPAVKGDQAI